ncbi:MAG: hypothetical protein ACRDRP_06910 [Pseudonocardiaceae bacterium]
MSPDTLRFVLQVVAIALGGGSVQMVIFLIKRRSELRSLDATSGSAALTSANEYIATLQNGEQAMRARSEAMQKQWDTERALLTDALDNERRQVARLSADVARFRADLAVAESQIEQLTRYGRPSARYGRLSAE